jgi:hypothetical protein
VTESYQPFQEPEAHAPSSTGALGSPPRQACKVHLAAKDKEFDKTCLHCSTSSQGSIYAQTRARWEKEGCVPRGSRDFCCLGVWSCSLFQLFRSTPSVHPDIEILPNYNYLLPLERISVARHSCIAYASFNYARIRATVHFASAFYLFPGPRLSLASLASASVFNPHF